MSRDIVDRKIALVNGAVGSPDWGRVLFADQELAGLQRGPSPLDGPLCLDTCPRRSGPRSHELEVPSWPNATRQSSGGPWSGERLRRCRDHVSLGSGEGRLAKERLTADTNRVDLGVGTNGEAAHTDTSRCGGIGRRHENVPVGGARAVRIVRIAVQYSGC